MEGNKTISKVIPDGEVNCIWVDAGLVSYKLCDRNFECDDCPFDQVMRQKIAPASSSTQVEAKKKSGGPSNSTAGQKQSTLFEVIDEIFAAPFSQKPPDDRSYSPGHVWFKEVAADTYRVGIDHYAASLLGGVGSIVFPQEGTACVRDNPCAWLICDDGTIAVESPMNGKIRKVNQTLAGSAALLHKDPYESGWLSEISCSEGVSKPYFDVNAIESSSKSEFHDLSRQIVEEFDTGRAALGVTLLDGGLHSRNLKDILGPARYISFLQKLYSRKP